MKKKIGAILKMIPFAIVLVIAIILSLQGINCATGLSWKTCSFLEGIIKIFTFLMPVTIVTFILFIIGLIEIFRKNKN